MKQIPLTQNKYALVDDEDYEYLSQWKWGVSTKGYAFRTAYNSGKGKYTSMHRLLLKPSPKLQVDHINGDKLDNRKSNLRTATNGQNRANTSKNRNDKYRYKGVYQNAEGIWLTYITYKNKSRYIGSFRNERHAALAYDLWAKDLFGEYAGTNFAST